MSRSPDDRLEAYLPLTAGGGKAIDESDAGGGKATDGLDRDT